MAADRWHLTGHVFVSSEPFGQQVATIDDTHLVRRFEIREPGKPARFFAYSSSFDSEPGSEYEGRAADQEGDQCADSSPPSVP